MLRLTSSKHRGRKTIIGANNTETDSDRIKLDSSRVLAVITMIKQLRHTSTRISY